MGVSISVCGDDGLEPKPSAEPLLAICTRLGVSPEEGAMVGDSAERDVGSGLAAGFGSVIGVSSGISQATHLTGAGAHAVVRDVSHVPEIIRYRHAPMHSGSV